jgi:hypothetical protein
VRRIVGSGLVTLAAVLGGSGADAAAVARTAITPLGARAQPAA